MSNTKRATPAPPPTLPPLSVLRMIWKQRPLILAAWLVLSALGLFGIYQIPDVYRAETLVLVESQKIPENFVASTVNSELQDRLATISQQILSSTRLQNIIDKFSLYPDLKRRKTKEEIIERMRSDIKIKLERGWTRNQPGAFRVTYSGAKPETTATVANQISNLFIEENLRSREVQAAGTSEFIEDRLQLAKKSLEEQEAKVARYKQEHNGQLPEQEQSLVAMLDRLRTQLQDSQYAVSRAQQTRQMLESSLEAAEASRTLIAGASNQAPGASVNTANTSGVPAPLRRSDALKRELEKLLVRYTDQHPLVTETRALLAAALQEEEANKEEQPKPGLAPAPALKTARVSPELAQLQAREQERIAGLKTQLAVATKDVEARENERKQILASIADCQARVGQLPLRQQEMAGLLRDYEFSKDNYKNLLNKNFAADIASEMEKRQKAERFTILDTARIPEKPAQPNRPILNTVCVLAALMLATVLGCAREWNKNVILGEWELPGHIPVLGRIPAIPSTALASPAAWQRR